MGNMTMVITLLEELPLQNPVLKLSLKRTLPFWFHHRLFYRLFRVSACFLVVPDLSFLDDIRILHVTLLKALTLNANGPKFLG